ncbi:hypothetical protein BAE44_0022503 [Dichanthelium oligosanthes]|uniref:Dof-type domain-containing protein n=1 Tax=Dichanthelium oligosanthes TaxID=888268 RepID=A0A1E5UU95_9POAL|nr:hypothetical protein BAE44_0022503 [Dichanthelium oligosanthes]
MDASRGPDRDQHQDTAIQLFGLSIPVPGSSTPPPPRPHPSTKVADDGGSSQKGKADDPKSEEAKADSGGSGEAKAFQKPDAILPCPRCNSVDTKFCYFNNYNEKQPRHYCRNCPAKEDEANTSSGSQVVLDLVLGSGDKKEERSCLPSAAVASGSSDNSEVGLSRLSLLPPMMPAPGIRAHAVPFPQVSPLWSCFPGWPNGAWTVLGTTLPSLPPSSVACSGGDSLALGKHPREEEKAEKTFWVPKALRVTDPEEAAKSTIWDSLGIKPDEGTFCK